MNGTMMCRKRWKALAPSIIDASMYSSGMVCRVASSTMMINGVRIHISEAITEIMAQGLVPNQTMGR